MPSPAATPEPSAPVVRRTHFVATSPTETRDWIGSTYSGRLHLGTRSDSSDRSWRVEFTQLDTDLFSVADSRLPFELTFDMVGRDQIVVATVLEGGIQVDHHQDRDRYGPGDVFLANQPRFTSLGTFHDLRLLTTVLPRSLITDVTGRHPTAPDATSELAGTNPVPGGAARWRRVNRYVEELLTDLTDITDPGATSPLVVGPAARMLAAGALDAFPHDAAGHSVVADRTDAHQTTLRRAVAFIEANPEADISVADIARAAYVTPRAVQLAFRRHLQTTPLAHLRRVRLDAAHRQLQRAVPGDGTTVTAVAARWGFTASRFSELHRAVYGVLPNRTLRD